MRQAMRRVTLTPLTRWDIEMAQIDHCIVFCYDITRARTRRRVAAALEHLLNRVQGSVFEGRLKMRAANTLFNRVDSLKDPGDSIRMYVLSRIGFEKSRQSGGANLPEDTDYWLM